MNGNPLYDLSLEPISELDRAVASVRDLGLMEGLPIEQLARLFPSMRVKRFRDEEIKCECPDLTHEAFILVNGRVATTRRIGQVEHVVELADVGDLFNAGGLVEYEENNSGARALGEVEIIAVDTRVLSKILAQNSELGYLVMKNLIQLVMRQSGRQLEQCLKAY